MRRTIQHVLIVSLLVGVYLCGVVAGQAHAVNRECRFGLGRHAMRQTVVCVAGKFNDVSRTTALYVADRESDFRAHAYNASSGASGIFQHLARYWPSRYRTSSPPRWGRMPSSVFNGRTNIIVALTMVHRGGWGPWS